MGPNGFNFLMFLKGLHSNTHKVYSEQQKNKKPGVRPQNQAVGPVNLVEFSIGTGTNSVSKNFQNSYLSSRHFAPVLKLHKEG